MKDNERMSKKQLKALANNLGATKIATDVYRYENKVYDLIKAYCNEKEYCTNKLVAYSCGVYGNNGRIDRLVFEDDDIQDMFVCWY